MLTELQVLLGNTLLSKEANSTLRFPLQLSILMEPTSAALDVLNHQGGNTTVAKEQARL